MYSYNDIIYSFFKIIFILFLWCNAIVGNWAYLFYFRTSRHGMKQCYMYQYGLCLKEHMAELTHELIPKLRVAKIV